MTLLLAGQISNMKHSFLFVIATVQLHCVFAQTTFTVPSAAPTSAVLVDPALLSLSVEFFAFPGYVDIKGTVGCLANLQSLRGSPPAVRIGGTTQDRATYDPSLTSAVNYSVASPIDAPTSLTFGPSFFDLAAQLPGDVTIGLNRELNNISNTQIAAEQAVSTIENLLAIELGNEPDLYSTGSPIAGGSWSQAKDGTSQKNWFTILSESVGNIFQAAVYISYPAWSTASLIPMLGNAIDSVKTFSDHAYPQSACNGASTDLVSLMSHSEIATFTSQFTSEALAAHDQGKSFFLGETNSATCGGGGISSTFGAGLWVMDYTLQSALNNVDRLYFHQGTIGDCAYCFWGTSQVFAPYYGAAFVSEFLGVGSDARLTALDDGTSSVAAYAVFPDSSSAPSRILLYNSAYFDGSGVRESTSITLTGLGNVASVQTKIMSAPDATSQSSVTIGGGGSFNDACESIGTQETANVSVSGGRVTLAVGDSEALIVQL